ncbi:MAG: GNAT family N-acetyltransferase [Anaerolineales bacterium]|nr:GNAT family N-acetyltransferase [Anaerolineales bacterium]MBX3038652.1 GNAT family N-acetyltransferase [Anaerolineales bacterium]
MKILETKRLILRHQTLDDLDSLWALYQNPNITKYIPDAPRSYEEAKEELEWHMHGHPKHPELGLWATIHKETGKFIGRCGLLPWTIDNQFDIEVAYTIAEEYWGQGLASEAAEGILNYGFENLNLSRLICLIDPENIGSQKVAEKIGMKFERKVDGYEGDNIPFYIYSIEKSSKTAV